MINWKSLILCWNSSRVGNAISDNSLIGVPSCFSGGRKMVKCTRSTEASAFSRLLGALARMRLARDQQHAQLVAHAVDRHHGAIVDGGEFAAVHGRGFD